MPEVLRESQQPVMLYTLVDAAGQLGVSVKTLRRLIDKGEVPSYRFGTAIRVNVAEVLQATKRGKPCPSTNAARRTTSTFRSGTVRDSDALLRLMIAKQRRSSTIS